MKLVDALVGSLASCEDFAPFWALLDAGKDAVCAVAQSARPFLVAARFARTPQPTLVVVPGKDAAADFAFRLANYLGEDAVMHFPDRKDWPWEDEKPDPRVIAQRMACLYALARGQDKLVVASGRSLIHKLAPASTRPFEPLVFACDAPASYESSALSFDQVGEVLVRFGYENTGSAHVPGSFAVRGGSIDVFPGNLHHPVRIDFFGDEIEEVRRLLPSTGQTIAQLDSVQVFPAREIFPSKRALGRAREALYKPSLTNPVFRDLLARLEEGRQSLKLDALLPFFYDKPVTVGDYLPSDALVVVIEPRSVFDDALHAFEDACARSEGTGIRADSCFCEASKLDFGSCQRASYQSIMRVNSRSDAEMPVKRTEVSGDPEKLFGRLRSFAEAGYFTVLSVPDPRARKDMMLELVDRGIPIHEWLNHDREHSSLPEHAVCVTDMNVPLGVVLPKAKIALVSLADVQGSRIAPKGKQVDVTEITFPFAPGDYVVHAAHGIAYFRDLVRREAGGVERDYLLLEYAEGDKLYVPVEQLDRVTRYVGPEGASPRLTRLNTSDWSRTLSRARKASRKLAFDLVDVYARRVSARGFAFGEDTPWQRQMEEDFPYQETPDQLAAIADVKADMCANRPMDRLICGDVGFGKTEVALRAAFKACQDRKQVMVLCPTTILAQQHYTTFSDRFEAYGVRVEVLSRFRTSKQQQDALSGFSDGGVDVLVGTHRLLSRDVNPRDLGLVIIDEEQRFGVGHKEQLKNLRESVDVLTLSATPIPRTMQMSLSGVRDMSLILTPPDDRRPVEVHVGEWDLDLVGEAIGRELDRGGQIYYVSNRVRSISDAVARVQEAAPSARIGVAHGKMSKDELERAMEDFSAGLTDVLVATTIIESGIDNPHTNTLIIEDSQRLGLAQMYQLKGRVGRSSRQAYAYFMFPEQVQLTEEAIARLTAIDEHRDLGSGMRVAMRDLEIRGAGTLLGAEQSGNMSAVGFDLFASMIATAVNEAREGLAGRNDGLPAVLSDVTVNVPEHSYLPEDYVKDADERVMAYRKLASAPSLDALSSLRDEIVSRHGPLPQTARSCFTRSRAKLLCTQLGCRSVSLVSGKVNIEPVPKPAGELSESLRDAKARYVQATCKLQVPVRFFGVQEDGSLLEAVCALLEDMCAAKERREASAQGL